MSPFELSGRRILLVDDDAPARASLARGLGDAGAIVFTSASDDAASFLCFSPAVFVIDHGPNRRHAVALLKLLRDSMAPRSVAALMLSTCVRASDREEAAAGGFDRFLGKPVPADLVVATLVDMLTCTAGSAAPRAGPFATGGGKDAAVASTRMK